MPYQDVNIPPDLDPVEYNYHQRRAEIHELIIQAGHPDLVNRSKFADYYGVSHTTIANDLERIREEIFDAVATEAKHVTQTIYTRGIREAVRDEEWDTAISRARSYNDWLFAIGEQKHHGWATDEDDETGPDGAADGPIDLDQQAYKIIDSMEADSPEPPDLPDSIPDYQEINEKGAAAVAVGGESESDVSNQDEHSSE